MISQKSLTTTPDLASRTIDHCRICNSSALHKYMDLGVTPLANSYLKKEQLNETEFTEELYIQLCKNCGLSQLTKVVHPDRMFRYYLWVSSTTQTILDHFAELAETVSKSVQAEHHDLAIDIASNDGTLLKAFMDIGITAIGVDPARNLAKEANNKGRTTTCSYWNSTVAKQIKEKYGPAKIITACNVFAHVDDLQEFMYAVDILLDKQGVFVIECPYVLDFIENNEFDTAYHEHLSYIALTPLVILMEHHGFYMHDFKYFSKIHGGTIRIYNKKGEGEGTKQLKAALKREGEFGIKKPKMYDDFAKRVTLSRKRLHEIIDDLTARGKTIWAYGASAKGNTLMNFFDLHAAQIPKVIDDNPKKCGYYTPGSHMEIVSPESLDREMPDYLLLLAWNFSDEIRRHCQNHGYKGGFIVPVPEAHVILGE